MIIWEICYGMRSPYFPYTCTDQRYYNMFNSDSVGNEFTDGATGANNGTIRNMKAVYRQVSDKMAQHLKRPSFLSTESGAAQIFDLTPNANGTYSVTLTDTNNMLSAVSFTNTDTLSFVKNGNSLTITANKPITEVTVRATKNVPNLEAQTFIVWTHTDKQTIVEPVSPTADPTPLYLKLRVRTGDLSIKKTTSDGKMLGGWKFTLYSDQACTKKVYGPYTTDSNGTITAKDLLAGTYWIREEGNVDPEVQEKYKCVGENPRKITLTVGQTTSVEFHNILQTGGVKLIKKTNTGGTLANWKIGIFMDEGCTKPITGSPFTTGTDGTIIVHGLIPGTYYAKEVDESDQYPYWHFDTEVKKVIVEEEKIASVTFTNIQYGKLRIKKIAVNGSPEGWSFELLDESKELITTLKTDADGYAYSELLLPGKYYVREIHDRDETYWTYDAEVEKEAAVTAGEEVTVEYTNEQFGRISFHKTTDSGKYLEGWVFQVTDEEGKLIGEYTTDETGFAITEKLKPGKYLVKEVARNDPYWVVNVETHTVDAMAGRTAKDEWHNHENGKGTFRKVTNTDKDLDGWIFTVYSDIACKNEVVSLTTDEDGKVSWMFEPGTYYVKETGDTKGRFDNPCWVIDKMLHIVTIRPHEETTVTFQNFLYGKISVRKVNPEGQSLADAEFMLEWSEDGTLWKPVFYHRGTDGPEGSCSNKDVVDGKLTTGADGIVTWERLYPDLYYRITETKAPNGFTLLTEPAFEGKLPEKDPIVTLKVVNARQFEMPQTGSASLFRMPIALLLCTLVCAGALFRLRKKRTE